MPLPSKKKQEKSDFHVFICLRWILLENKRIKEFKIVEPTLVYEWNLDKNSIMWYNLISCSIKTGSNGHYFYYFFTSFGRLNHDNSEKRRCSLFSRIRVPTKLPESSHWLFASGVSAGKLKCLHQTVLCNSYIYFTCSLFFTFILVFIFYL